MATAHITLSQLVVRTDSLANDSLSGLATRQGVTPVDGDLVLVVAQTDATQNGPYVARSAAWDRVTSVTTGQVFYVSSGSDAGRTYQLTTAGISPSSFNSATGACGTSLTFTGGAATFNSLAPGPIGGTTPGTVTATDVFLTTSASAARPGQLQLVSTAGQGALLIRAGSGCDTQLGQETSSATARASIRTMSISLATNATYDYVTSGLGGSAVIATADGAIVATVGFSGAGVATTGGLTFTNFSTTLTTASKLNVGASGGALRFENKTASTISVIATITQFLQA